VMRWRSPLPPFGYDREVLVLRIQEAYQLPSDSLAETTTLPPRIPEPPEGVYPVS